MYKICLQCPTEFKATHTTQKYCSNQCQWDAKKTAPEERTCHRVGCGNKFIVLKPSDKKKYCSRSCSATSTNSTTPKRVLEGSCETCSHPISASLKYCEAHRNTKNLTIRCELCKTEVTTDRASQKFCSVKCRQKSYTGKAHFSCKECKESFNSTSRTKICKKCSIKNKQINRINDWLTGSWDGAVERGLSKTIRNYLLAEADFACSGCGFDKSHPDDGASILEIDHIDGDGLNHSPNNLRVLCPNCHALTSSYRGRNLGKGTRTKYYIRVM